MRKNNKFFSYIIYIMDVEIVKWDKENGKMDLVEDISFKTVEEAQNYYENWSCFEENNSNFIITGKNWNNGKKESKPSNADYLYTYSVNLIDPEDLEDLCHSHNFAIFKKKIN